MSAGFGAGGVFPGVEGRVRGGRVSPQFGRPWAPGGRVPSNRNSFRQKNEIPSGTILEALPGKKIQIPTGLIFKAPANQEIIFLPCKNRSPLRQKIRNPPGTKFETPSGKKSPETPGAGGLPPGWQLGFETGGGIFWGAHHAAPHWPPLHIWAPHWPGLRTSTKQGPANGGGQKSRGGQRAMRQNRKRGRDMGFSTRDGEGPSLGPRGFAARGCHHRSRRVSGRRLREVGLGQVEVII